MVQGVQRRSMTRLVKEEAEAAAVARRRVRQHVVEARPVAARHGVADALACQRAVL